MLKWKLSKKFIYILICSAATTLLSNVKTIAMIPKPNNVNSNSGWKNHLDDENNKEPQPSFNKLSASTIRCLQQIHEIFGKAAKEMSINGNVDVKTKNFMVNFQSLFQAICNKLLNENYVNGNKQSTDESQILINSHMLYFINLFNCMFLQIAQKINPIKKLLSSKINSIKNNNLPPVTINALKDVSTLLEEKVYSLGQFLKQNLSNFLVTKTGEIILGNLVTEEIMFTYAKYNGPKITKNIFGKRDNNIFEDRLISVEDFNEIIKKSKTNLTELTEKVLYDSIELLKNKKFENKDQMRENIFEPFKNQNNSGDENNFDLNQQSISALIEILINNFESIENLKNDLLALKLNTIELLRAVIFYFNSHIEDYMSKNSNSIHPYMIYYRINYISTIFIWLQESIFVKISNNDKNVDKNDENKKRLLQIKDDIKKILKIILDKLFYLQNSTLKPLLSPQITDKEELINCLYKLYNSCTKRTTEEFNNTILQKITKYVTENYCHDHKHFFKLIANSITSSTTEILPLIDEIIEPYQPKNTYNENEISNYFKKCDKKIKLTDLLKNMVDSNKETLYNLNSEIIEKLKFFHAMLFYKISELEKKSKEFGYKLFNQKLLDYNSKTEFKSYSEIISEFIETYNEIITLSIEDKNIQTLISKYRSLFIFVKKLENFLKNNITISLDPHVKIIEELGDKIKKITDDFKELILKPFTKIILEYITQDYTMQKNNKYRNDVLKFINENEEQIKINIYETLEEEIFYSKPTDENLNNQTFLNLNWETFVQQFKEKIKKMMLEKGQNYTNKIENTINDKSSIDDIMKELSKTETKTKQKKKNKKKNKKKDKKEKTGNITNAITNEYKTPQSNEKTDAKIDNDIDNEEEEIIKFKKQILNDSINVNKINKIKPIINSNWLNEKSGVNSSVSSSKSNNITSNDPKKQQMANTKFENIDEHKPESSSSNNINNNIITNTAEETSHPNYNNKPEPEIKNASEKGHNLNCCNNEPEDSDNNGDNV